MIARLTKLTVWTSLMMLTAGPLSAQSVLKNHDTEQPIDISAERLEVKQKQGQAVFSGTVIVKQGQMAFAADSLTVFYDLSKGSDNPVIDRLDARGNVSLTSTTEQIQSNWGIYDVKNSLVTMGGAVSLTRSGSNLNGERLELDLVSGLTKLDGKPGDDGRVTGTFKVPEKTKN